MFTNSNSAFCTANRLSVEESEALAFDGNLSSMIEQSRFLRDFGHENRISYSKKVFIPLTRLCRDVCHYCTFAKTPDKTGPAFLSLEQVLNIARLGADAGCREALFTLGDKPELRYRRAHEELKEKRHETTLSYLREAAELVLNETGLLPHLNPGLMTVDDFKTLRPYSASMGLMLETVSKRLSQQGGPHYGSPDKDPLLRLKTIEAAGKTRTPFTTGLLIGIGETRLERIQALLVLRQLNDQFGHIQEIIIQNFRAKPKTRMANHPEPALEELIWTIACARLIFGSAMNIQTPPNLNQGNLAALIDAGINDWGGVSPVTKDYVNPEHQWPELDTLREETAKSGKILVERTPVYPEYLCAETTWIAPSIKRLVFDRIDSTGLVREDNWRAGVSIEPPVIGTNIAPDLSDNRIDLILTRAEKKNRLNESDLIKLFNARGEAVDEICDAADSLRKQSIGNTVTYVVNCNINYTNICSYKCQFCAFSKSPAHANRRDRPYNFDIEEIQKRALEARSRGATELCLQGGIHPHYTGNTYLDICKAVKQVTPDLHIHAFSPLEIWHGANSLRIPVDKFLSMLMDNGLGSLPGTAAEILDDKIRKLICPDKINTDTWLTIIESAHRLGLPTTSTMMFGHVENPYHWARHLLILRDLQERTQGLTEFVPLPFVPDEAPMYKRGLARPGPTYRETLLVSAISRIALFGMVDNIQVSWVKMGIKGALQCLNTGVNDLGGVLMYESITRAAGARHGQEFSAELIHNTILGIGRKPQQRNTLYHCVREMPNTMHQPNQTEQR